MEYFKITDGPGKTTSELMNECRAKFKVWSWFDDKELDKDFPAPKKETVRYFKKTVEPDENLKGKSASDLEKEGIECITFRERLIMELQYFNETGEHLDVVGWTLCAGSRYADGCVPRLFWSPACGEVQALRGSVDYCFPAYGPRAAVLNPLNLSSSTLGLDEAVKVYKAAGYQVSKIL